MKIPWFNRSRTGRLASTGLATALVLTTVSGALGSPAAQAAAVPAGTATQTVTVWTTSGVSYDWQQTLIPGFEKATGIKVVYDQIPEVSITDKIQVAQQAKSKAFSIFEDPESESSTYKAFDGVTALMPFINNSQLTPSSYNFKGISVGEEGQCILNGVLYCLPVSLDAGPMLFLEQGIVPRGWDFVGSYQLGPGRERREETDQ